MLTGDNMDAKHTDAEYITQLTELERRLILTLAKKGPMSGYDFHLGGKRVRGSREALMSSGYWVRIKKHMGPEDLDLIQVVKLRGRCEGGSKRRRDLYWLTLKGIMLGFLNGVSPVVLFKHARKYYPKNPHGKPHAGKVYSTLLMVSPID